MHVSGSGARRGVGGAEGSPVLSAAPASLLYQTDYKSVINVDDLPLGSWYLPGVDITTFE